MGTVGSYKWREKERGIPYTYIPTNKIFFNEKNQINLLVELSTLS
jgi:hypothetical protein